MEQPAPGRSAHTAYIVNTGEPSKTQALVDKIITQTFGGNNGEYFILNESIIDNRRMNKKFKVVLVEDKNKVHHQLWFYVSDLVRKSNNTWGL